MKICALFLCAFMACATALLGNLVVQPPVTISLLGGDAAPQVAIDSNGNAIAVWVNTFPNSPTLIEAARYTAATNTWTAPFIVAQWVRTSIMINAGGSPQVGVDASGNAIAVWVNGSTNQIEASRFNVTTMVWSPAVQVSLSNQFTVGGVNSLPQVSVDPNGNAVAVWVLSQPFQSFVLASCFNPTTLVWSLPIVLTATGTVPQVAIDANGDGVALWQTILTGNPSLIQASSFEIP